MSSNFVEMFAFDDGEDAEEDSEREPPHRPPWLGPPENELGAAVPLGLVIARSEKGVVALSHAIVYSSGVTLDVIAAARGLTNSQSNRLFHEQHVFEEKEEPPSGFLRIGLELPDGERVSNLGARMGRRFMKPDEEPDGPVFMPHGGGGGLGGQGRVRMNPAFWLWPRPEAGAMRVFCEWPVVEISLSTVEIDAAELLAAAERIVSLWPSA